MIIQDNIQNNFSRLKKIPRAKYIISFNKGKDNYKKDILKTPPDAQNYLYELYKIEFL